MCTRNMRPCTWPCRTARCWRHRSEEYRLFCADRVPRVRSPYEAADLEGGYGDLGEEHCLRLWGGTLSALGNPTSGASKAGRLPRPGTPATVHSDLNSSRQAWLNPRKGSITSPSNISCTSRSVLFWVKYVPTIVRPTSSAVSMTLGDDRT